MSEQEQRLKTIQELKDEKYDFIEQDQIKFGNKYDEKDEQKFLRFHEKNIYHAQFKNKNQTEYQKCIIKDSNNEDQEYQIREIKAMYLLNNHENILKIMGFCNLEQHNSLGIILEFFEPSHFRDFQQNSQLTKKSLKLSIEEKFEVCIKLQKALKYIHDKGIIHRNIYHKNILIYRNNNNHNDMFLKIYGFQYCQLKDQFQNYEKLDQKGIVRYRSPEMNSVFDEENEKTDYFSLGLLFYYIFTDNPPWCELKPIEIESKLENGCNEGMFVQNWEQIIKNQQLNYNVDCIIEAIKKMTNFDPEKRNIIDSQTLINQFYDTFSGILNKNLKEQKIIFDGQVLADQQYLNDLLKNVNKYFNSLEHPQLQILDLSNNQLGDLGIEKLSVVLIQFNALAHLQQLTISNNNITCKGAFYISRMIEQQKNNSLQHLDLSSNQFQKKGFKTIFFKLIRKQCTNISYINLSETFLNNYNQSMNQFFLVFRILKFQNLSCLILNGINFDQKFYKSLFNLLSLDKRPYLSLIELNNAGISDDVLQSMLQSIIKMGCKDLQKILLSSNQISLQGAHKILNALENYQNLKFIDLKNNQLNERELNEFNLRISQITMNQKN